MSPRLPASVTSPIRLPFSVNAPVASAMRRAASRIAIRPPNPATTIPTTSPASPPRAMSRHTSPGRQTSLPAIVAESIVAMVRSDAPILTRPTISVPDIYAEAASCQVGPAVARTCLPVCNMC